MPHVSKQKVSDGTKKEIATLFTTLIADTSASTRKHVLHELLTDTEKVMLAKRLAITYLIHKGTPTHDIADTLGVSSSTVSRFEHAVASGVFGKTNRWLHTTRIGKPIIQLLEKLASIPFDAQKKSLAQLSKDW